MNAIKVATLLTAFLAPHVARATTALTFFEHSSCNAGTSFQSYNDPNALQADTSCHQLPNGTVAVYVNQIDDGCTLRIYTSSDCSPLASSPAGLLVPGGNCFFVDEGVDLGSWRPDCAGVDYSSSNGLDRGNSYSNNANDGSDEIYSALVTANGGVVTLTATAAASTSTSSSTSQETAAATTSASGGNSTSGAAGKGGASQTTSAGAGASQTSHSGSSPGTRLVNRVSTIGVGVGMFALVAVLS
ncbi:hypothetical protein H2204_001213 [Knufia peltigerae]|uniref:Uncharacterized protein n=1 Tax=Knufia peltigerae TaxID=1002370 RepID=A0AA39D4C8_9EURO|nr:hypothetical protein H2204_001213 [Knufia peltigerae]